MIQGSPMMSGGGTPSADGAVQVFRVARGWKIFLTLATPVLALLAGGLMLLPFLGERSGGAVMVAVCALIGAGGLAFCLYVLFSVYKSRLEIHPDRIVDVGLFKSVTMPLDAIGGYRIVQTQHTSSLQLWPRDAAGKKLSVSLTMERKDEFLAWVENHLVDLDAVAAEQELSQILDDTSLGETREERQSLLDRARLWTKLANGATYVLALWAFFYPEPYDVLIFSLLVLPWVALLLLWQFPRAIKINGERNSPLPDITPTFLFPSLALALRALLDFNILDWAHFWLPCAVMALGLCAALLFLVPTLRGKLGVAILLLLFTLVYGYGAIITLNGVLDRTRRQTYYATVVAKHVSHGKHTSYYLKLSAWGPRSGEEEVDVGSETYERRSVGDRVPVVVRQGRFAIPWFYVAD